MRHRNMHYKLGGSRWESFKRATGGVGEQICLKGKSAQGSKGWICVGQAYVRCTLGPDGPACWQLVSTSSHLPSGAPHEDLAVAYSVKRVVGLGDTHARHEDDLLQVVLHCTHRVA